jgi:hypothetical protein
VVGKRTSGRRKWPTGCGAGGRDSGCHDFGDMGTVGTWRVGLGCHTRYEGEPWHGRDSVSACTVGSGLAVGDRSALVCALQMVRMATHGQNMDVGILVLTSSTVARVEGNLARWVEPFPAGLGQIGSFLISKAFPI